MAVRETTQIGDPRLKASNKRIKNFNDPVLKQLVEDLVDSMRAGGLIGMAAPQIGENYKVFVTEPRETKTRSADQTDELRVYINPVMVEESAEESIIYEGCGSVIHGKLFGPVKRSREIVIEAFDIDGKKFRFRCDGILARVIQHEYDHLSGIEFTEKVSDYRKLMSVEFYLKNIKLSKEQTEASLITEKEFVVKAPKRLRRKR